MKLSGFKSLGNDGWVGFFSNIFPDRDVLPDAPEGERFTYEALKEYAAWANSDEDNLPDLEFWHLPNVKMGKAAAVEVMGPLIVAWGPWGSDEVGQKAKTYFSSTKKEWAMSHGYHYWPWERVKGEYHRFRTHEVTVLSPEWAANSVTLFTEGSMAEAKKAMLDDLKSALRELFGTDEASASDIAAKGIGQNKALADAAQVAGAATGQKDGEAAPAAASAAAETEVAVGDDDLALALADALLALQKRDEQIAEMGKHLKSLTDGMEAMKAGFEQRVKALEEADTKQKSLMPRALAQALAQRASEKGSEVAAAEVVDDAKKQAALLDATTTPDPNSDPMGWMASMAGMNLGSPK